MRDRSTWSRLKDLWSARLSRCGLEVYDGHVAFTGGTPIPNASATDVSWSSDVARWQPYPGRGKPSGARFDVLGFRYAAFDEPGGDVSATMVGDHSYRAICSDAGRSFVIEVRVAPAAFGFVKAIE